MRSIYILVLLSINWLTARAQVPETVVDPNIKSIQFYQHGNQLSYPVLQLHGTEQLDLHFDDLAGDVKNISYTYQLCNADWTPSNLSHFDYIKGFSQVRISNYRYSSVAYTRYTHYQATLPDRSSMPSRSGNYILKVFLNSDTSQLLFTRRMMVVEERTSIGAMVQQPMGGLKFQTHQKIQFSINAPQDLNIVNPHQQTTVVILQNGRWDNAATGIKPSFFSRTKLEYNTERDAVFESGKEWRWVDLRSFRFQSDRIAEAVYKPNQAEVYLKPDGSRVSQRFNFYRDNNGRYSIETTETINPFWQGDYANIHFTYVPSNNNPLQGKDLFVFGELSGYKLDEGSRMEYNAEKGVYEKTLLLKQGFYDFNYATVETTGKKRSASFEFTEGNFWETANDYMIFFYYRPLGGRSDELIGFTTVSTALRR